LKGEWVHKSGVSFKGLFYKDRFQKGTFYFPDGDSFEGEWTVTYKKYKLKKGIFKFADGSSTPFTPNQNLYIPSRIISNKIKNQILSNRKEIKSMQNLNNQRRSQLFKNNIYSPSFQNSRSNSRSVSRSPNRFNFDKNDILSDTNGKDDFIDKSIFDAIPTKNIAISIDQVNQINENNYLISQFLDKPEVSSETSLSKKGQLNSLWNEKSTRLGDQETRLVGKIFFSDCSNGTSCLFVGHFDQPECVSTKNALIIGIGGFYQEFVNDDNAPSLPNSNRLNLHKIFQFSYSPRIGGAFLSEEEFDKGENKCSKTLYYNGIYLQYYQSRKYVPIDLVRHLPDKRNLTYFPENKKSFKENKSSVQDSENIIGYISFPFEKHLISILGYFVGNIQSFSIRGIVLFNNSLKVSRVKMGFQISKSRLQFKLPKFEKVISSLESFFDHIQLTQMKIFLDKPNSSKLNGFHIYQTSKNRIFNGFFFNDYLMIHKDTIPDSMKESSSSSKDSIRKTKTTSCLNCSKKSLSTLNSSLQVEQLISLLKSKLCSNCNEKFFNNNSSQKYNSYYSKASNQFNKSSKMNSEFASDLEKNVANLEKTDFPFESPFKVDSSGYGLNEFIKEDLSKGPTRSPNYFKGEINDGKKQGFVYENFKDEECFAGFYKNGFRQGFGQLYKYGKFHYKGQFRKGRQHGQGIIKFVNGETYECQFRNNSLVHSQIKGQIKAPIINNSNKKYSSRYSISPKNMKSEHLVLSRDKNRKEKKRNHFSQTERIQKVEFSRLQANSKAMRLKKNELKQVSLFQKKFIEDSKDCTLNEWIYTAHKKIQDSDKKFPTPKWTKEQQEMFDDKSDLEISDLEASSISRSISKGRKLNHWKSPKRKSKTVFLFKNIDSLNFKNDHVKEQNNSGRFK
jgi:hypothetical protein